MYKKPHRRVIFLFFGVQLLLAAALALYLWMSKTHVPVSVCPFLYLTRLYCPGCGGTRAALALLRGDVLGSLSANPTVLFLAGALLYYEIAFCRFFLGKKPLRRISLHPLYLVAAVFFVHFLLRNGLFLAFGIDPLGDLVRLRG